MKAENVTYTAKWTYYTLTTNASLNGAGTYTSYSNKKVTAETEMTLTATINSGYIWLGWYNGDTLLAADLSYTFEMPAENIMYTAKWSKVAITLSRSNTSAGAISSLTGKYKNGQETTITATTNSGYTWLGWYNGDTLLTTDTSYTFVMNTEAATYTATWTYYTLTTDTNLSEAGTYTSHSNKKITAGTSTTLKATTNGGYIWLGWYNEDTLLTVELSYTFAMPAESVTYTAKWSEVTITLTRNDTSAGTVSPLSDKYTYGQEITVTAETNDGYTWLGWYNGDTLLTTDMSYTFAMHTETAMYTATWTYYTITTTTNISEAGTYTIYTNKKATVGTETTLTATTNSGYTWCGWYDSDTLLTDELSYTFTMPAANVTYTATWSKTTVTKNISTAGTITSLSDTYINGQEITVTAIKNIGYDWLGWYNGTTLLTRETSYTFTMTSKNVTYTACYQLKVEMSNFVFNSTTTSCSITGVNDNAVTEIVVPDYVVEINEGAFSGCGDLTSITLPFLGGSAIKTKASSSTLFGYIFGVSSYTGGVSTKQYYSSIYSATYYIPKSLKSVTITGGHIFYGAFYNCDGLRNITIPDDVTSIGDDAFYNCSKLTNITIPDGVTSIGSSAFKDCYKLIEVYNKSTLTITAGESSYGYIGYYAKAVYTPTSGESKLSTDRNGYVIYTDEENKLLVDYIGTATDLALTGDITEIYREAFANCSSLTSIEIPDSITSIGIFAFANCSSLTSIEIPNSVTSIDAGMFFGCSRLASITLHGNVTSIGTFAFNVCGNLTSVYYKGTVDDWAKITINDYNTCLTEATRYYYSESEPRLNDDGTAYDGNYWYYNDNNEIVVWVYTKKE